MADPHGATDQIIVLGENGVVRAGPTITLAAMDASWARTVCVFSAVAVGCIAVGVTGAVIGVPGNYGLETADAIAALDSRPVAWTAGWVSYAIVLLLLSLARARTIARRKPWIRGTLARGSIWLWGGIGAPWFYAYMAWDLQLYDLDLPGTDSLDVPFTLTVALWWWLGSLACLVVGALWSGWIASHPEPLSLERAADSTGLSAA